MSGGDGRRTAKRTRHDQQQPHQQPHHHSHPPMQQPMHPAYYPPPPSGAGMYPWMAPPVPHPGMLNMPQPGGYAAPPPAREPAAQAQTPARTAAARRRRVSPTTDSDHGNINTGSTGNRRTTTTSASTPAPPLHLRVAYRTQTHTCANCPISSPSSTFVTHPGPQHYPTCPRHRHANSTSTSSTTSASTSTTSTTVVQNRINAGGRIDNLANHQTRCSHAKVQSALTREYRTTQRRIEEHIQKQRGEVLAELERSRRRQLEEALGSYRAANAALGRIPIGGSGMMGMVGTVGHVPMPLPTPAQGTMPVPPRMPPARVPTAPPQVAMEPTTAATKTLPRDLEPDPKPTEEERAVQDMEAAAGEEDGDGEASMMLPPLPSPEEELIEPLPLSNLPPIHDGGPPANPNNADIVDPAHSRDAAVEEEEEVADVDQLIAEAGLDGDDMGLYGGGESAEPQCVQHLVRSKKRRRGGAGGGPSLGAAAAPTTNRSPARPRAAAPADTSAVSTTTNTNTTTATATAPPGPKCSQCKSPLAGGPPAAMCTSDKCRTMLCGPCLEEHRATAPDHSWCSDCGRVVNIVCRACLETEDYNEFLRCRAANCEQYCCPSHIRMMDCAVCGPQPFCHGATRKCATVQCEGCGDDGVGCDRLLCGQMLCALKEGCICGKRRDDPNVDWAVTIMGEARKQDKLRAEAEAEAEEDPVESVGGGRKGRAKKASKKGRKRKMKLPMAKRDGIGDILHADDTLHANIHEIQKILAEGGDDSNEMASI